MATMRLRVRVNDRDLRVSRIGNARLLRICSRLLGTEQKHIPRQRGCIMNESDVEEPDPQAALPQATEWSNAPTDKVGLSDDQPGLDELDGQADGNSGGTEEREDPPQDDPTRGDRVDDT